ncbi:MAG: hypothetical protein QF745_08545 [Planctomycetota bacterium]|nr:hypothetical protein [Planctomycetota bacterium]
MASHEQIKLAAQELFDRHGENAVGHATERVDRLKRFGSQPELDVALRVLSAVENLS